MADDVVRIAMALPEYIVERELGRGGMGVVFVGRHRRLDRPVAIKELPPAFAVDPEVRERFSTEARTLASLSHPHIVPIFDYVERESLCLIVMEQLPGGTLWDRFTTSGVTATTGCAVVMACCAALQHAHDRGVLHLDVKPDNLMFDRDGTLKVTDFGISSVIGGGRTLGTVDGTVLGMPAYMAPEQARGEALTPATDTYAAGVMLYELLSGQLPWQGAETANELLRQRLAEDPTPLVEAAPRVPPGVAAVVMQALERDPEERFTRAEDLGAAIGEAAAMAWGPTWLDGTGTPILGSERIAVAARSTSPHGEPSAWAAAHAAGVAAGVAGQAPPSMSVMRAGGPRLRGLDLNLLERGDLVDVDDLIHPPELPRRNIAALAALVVAMLVLACTGLVSAGRTAGLHRGDVLLGGVDVASSSRVRVDLKHDIPVVVADGRLAARADEVVLRLSTVGVPLGEVSTNVYGGRAVLDPGLLRLLASGKVTAQVRLLQHGRELVRHEFAFRSTSTWYLTAMGILSVLVLLIAFANLESSVKPLLRGRGQRFGRLSTVGAGVWGAVVGIGLVALSASLGVKEMSLSALVVVGLLGAAAGVLTCYVTAGVGRRRRLRRAMKRAGRSMSQVLQVAA